MAHAGERLLSSTISAKVNETLINYPEVLVLKLFSLAEYDETKVAFWKVDVDDLSSVAQEKGIRQMPTFLVFKQRKEVLLRSLTF